MLRYSSSSLFRIRLAVSSKKPSLVVMTTMKLLGILRYRGRRAGVRFLRTIPVILTAGTVSANNSKTTRMGKPGVCKQNLIYPALVSPGSNRHAIDKDNTIYGLLNIRSLLNKTSDLLEI